MAYSNYEKVALIYDYLMQGVDYEGWADYIEGINLHLNFQPSRILDLACGTGAGTLALAARGYDVVGLDISWEMLEIARKKALQKATAQNEERARARAREAAQGAQKPSPESVSEPTPELAQKKEKAPTKFLKTVHEKTLEEIWEEKYCEQAQEATPELAQKKAQGATPDIAYENAQETTPELAQGVSWKIASQTAPQPEITRDKPSPIEFLQQDMRTFSLHQPVDMVVIFQDGLNYLLSRDYVLQAFKRVHAALQPGGLFAFDLHSLEMLPRGLGETHMAEEEEFTLIWQSDYLEEDALWEITLTGFLKNPTGLYQRFQETHRERQYTPQEISSLLMDAGFGVEEVFKAFTFERDLTARRLYFVARKGERGR